MTRSHTLTRLIAAAGAVAALAATTACSSTAPSSAPGHHPSGSSTSSQAARRSPSSSPSPVTSTPPAPSAAAAPAPVAFAKKVWAVWSDNKLTEEAWWAKLKPMLSVGARGEYEGTKPGMIPDLTLRGPMFIDKHPKGPDAAVPGGANVVVPTNRGRFELVLEHNHGQWLLVGITFPPGVQ